MLEFGSISGGSMEANTSVQERHHCGFETVKALKLGHLILY